MLGDNKLVKMPFWGLRNSLTAGKNMYHEENLRPDSILKSRTQQLLKMTRFWQNFAYPYGKVLTVNVSAYRYRLTARLTVTALPLAVTIKPSAHSGATKD